MFAPYVIFRLIGWLLVLFNVLGIFATILGINREVKISKTTAIITLIVNSLAIWFLYTAMNI